jgi:exocyst complex component 2
VSTLTLLSGNRFLLSSTTFSPALFLSQVHSNASTESLLHGLDVLSRSIDQKSASLKVLVESNFERFVRAKATIDNVYTEMKNRGVDPQKPRARPHSRHASRNSFRASSGSGLMYMAESPENKKKNALTKESEYGVLGIKAPLIDVSAKAEEVWGPALGGREKEQTLKLVASTVDQHREIYEASGAIADCIKRKDYESLVEEYGKAKRFSDDARKLADELVERKTTPSDTQVQQIIIAARMWHDVSQQIEVFEREVWRRLIAVQHSGRGTSEGRQDQHLELISILLELGVEDNPIWVWLLSRYDNLKSKIQAISDRSKVEIEVLRRHLANSPKPTPQMVASHLQSLSRHSLKDKPTMLDSPDVIELWERMYAFLNTMLSSQGILGEVLEFWRTVQGFIDGKTQQSLPTGVDGSSRAHHRLSDTGKMDLQRGTIELIDMIREGLFSFFADPPPDDISAIFSPIPPTPGTPNPASLTPTSLRDPRFAFDAKNMPPPSPRLGETWEKFAFWPPWSNSLSGVHYLSKLLTLVGTGSSEMAAVPLVGEGDGSALDRLRSLVGGARERCVIAICAAWNKDAENIKVLEDWKRSSENRDLTRMPANFSAFESAILSGMQKILYISEAVTKPGPADVVLPPPAKLLHMVRSQFVTTLYKALSGMVENAEKAVKKMDDDWTIETGGLVNSVTMASATSIVAGTVNASDRVCFLPFILSLANNHRMCACC